MACDHQSFLTYDMCVDIQTCGWMWATGRKVRRGGINMRIVIVSAFMLPDNHKFTK